MDHYLTVSRVLYLWNFLMDNKNIYHIAEAVRTRAKGLACIHMAKLSLPLLNIMDSSSLISGNRPCLMLSLEQCPGMLASTGHPNNIDIEGSVFTTWFPKQCSTPAVNQQRWLCNSTRVCVLALLGLLVWVQPKRLCVSWSRCPLSRHPQDSSPFVPGRVAVPGCCNMHARVAGSVYCSLSFLCKTETLFKVHFLSGLFFGLHNMICEFSIYHGWGESNYEHLSDPSPWKHCLSSLWLFWFTSVSDRSESVPIPGVKINKRQ